MLTVLLSTVDRKRESRHYKNACSHNTNDGHRNCSLKTGWGHHTSSSNRLWFGYEYSLLTVSLSLAFSLPLQTLISRPLAAKLSRDSQTAELFSKALAPSFIPTCVLSCNGVISPKGERRFLADAMFPRGKKRSLSRITGASRSQTLTTLIAPKGKIHFYKEIGCEISLM